MQNSSIKATDLFASHLLTKEDHAIKDKIRGPFGLRTGRVCYKREKISGTGAETSCFSRVRVL